MRYAHSRPGSHHDAAVVDTTGHVMSSRHSTGLTSTCAPCRTHGAVRHGRCDQDGAVLSQPIVETATNSWPREGVSPRPGTTTLRSHARSGAPPGPASRSPAVRIRPVWGRNSPDSWTKDPGSGAWPWVTMGVGSNRGMTGPDRGSAEMAPSTPPGQRRRALWARPRTQPESPREDGAAALPRPWRRALWARPTTPSEPGHEHETGVPTAKRSPLLTFVAIAVVLGIAVAAFVAIASIGGPSYQATIRSITPDGASQVIVDVQVTNLGATASTPTCQVDVSSSAGAFTGTGTFKLNRPLSKSSSATQSTLIHVTTDGATRVNIVSSSAVCN